MQISSGGVRFGMFAYGGGPNYTARDMKRIALGQTNKFQYEIINAQYEEEKLIQNDRATRHEITPQLQKDLIEKARNQANREINRLSTIYKKLWNQT